MIKKNTDYYIDLDILQQFKYNKNKEILIFINNCMDFDASSHRSASALPGL